MPRHIIEVETDHPDALHIIRERAQQIAEDLDREGSTHYRVGVLDENHTPVTGWEGPLDEEDETLVELDLPVIDDKPQG